MNAAVETIDGLCSRLTRYLEDEEVRQVRRAYLYSEQAHDGQKRRSGDPYIIHPLQVAEILADMRMDHQSLMAAMLHDVMEHDGHRRALDRDDSGAYAQPPRPRGCAVPGQYAAPRARRAARYHPYARPT